MMQIDYYSLKNRKGDDKENEDFLLANVKGKRFILLDGVSRDRENGRYPCPSPAAEVSVLFAQECMDTMREMKNIHAGPIEIIRQAVAAGNTAVREYNRKHLHPFPAGTVGIVALIEKNLFCYGYTGDCFGLLIRGEKRYCFTEEQTALVHRHIRELTTAQIRNEICNHIMEPYAYGVWDGNPDAMDLVRYGTINLKNGDTIILYSDGAAEAVDQCSDPVNTDLEELLTDSGLQNTDDKTILRIRNI